MVSSLGPWREGRGTIVGGDKDYRGSRERVLGRIETSVIE